MTHLLRCPGEGPVMVHPSDGVLLLLMMAKLKITFADCSLQVLGLGPK